MKIVYFKKFKSLLLGMSIMSVLAIMLSCNEDEDGSGGGLANEIALSGDATQAVIEGDGTTEVTVTYNFTIGARAAGSATINATTDNLTYGTNYTTDPAESSGVITVAFAEAAESVSFTITIIDDQVNLPDGSVTFTLASIEGEDSDVSATAATFTLSIQDNEGESVNSESDETVSFDEVVPGTNSDPKELKFTSLNVVSDMTATASEGFEVSNAQDGTYAATATLASTATSVFVRVAPDASAALGELTGTVTITVGDVSEEFSVSAIVSSVVGELFWADNFDYPIDDTYPAYLDTYPTSYAANETGQQNWGIIPVSAKYRAAAAYNGSDASVPVITGLARTGVFDTWYTGLRLRSVAMGDGPLSLTGYPGSGVGRTARLALDYSNQSQKANCNNEGAFLSKNTFMARRFVDDGNEITSGNLYFSAMVKVNEVFDESTSTLKNAVFMLTGDATFVGTNAMKLNIKNDGAGGYNFGVSKSGDDGSVVYGSTSYTLGQTYAVILKVEIKEDLEGADPNDVLSVFVFKEGDTIPSFEDDDLTPEAEVNETNQDLTDVHDVTSGLEIFYFREIGDVFSAGGIDQVEIHDVEFSGVRVATSWSSLLKDASQALYDNQSDDDLQTMMYGQAGCATGPVEKIGNTDK